MVRSCAQASRGNPGKLAASLITGEKIPEPSESTCFTPAGIVASRLSYRSNPGLRLVRPAHIFGCEVKCKWSLRVQHKYLLPILSEERTRDSGRMVGKLSQGCRKETSIAAAKQFTRRTPTARTTSKTSSFTSRLTVSQKESNMRRGDVMVQMQNIKVLFIAGFGPIVPEAAPSRRLYSQMLGINFQEETRGYLHTEALKGANSFALWPLSQAAQSCLGQDSWPKEIPAPQTWLEFDADNVEQE